MTHPMIVHDAKEFAGVFYEQKRTNKFRATWPNQMDYVNANWPNFVVHVRSAYATMLTRHDVPQAEKDKIYQALTADAQKNQSDEAIAPLQLAPDTEAFQGDRRENVKTDESFGTRPGRTTDIAKRMLLGTTRH